MTNILLLRYLVHAFDNRGDRFYPFREGKRKIMELEQVVIKGITVAFLELHLFCPYVSRLLGSVPDTRLLSRAAIGREIGAVIDRKRSTVLLQRILAFEIQSHFLEGINEYGIEFILLRLAVLTRFFSAGRTGFEVQERRRKLCLDNPYMKNGWKIQILE